MTPEEIEQMKADREAAWPGHWTVTEFDEHYGYDCMTAGIGVGPILLDGYAYGQERNEPCKPEIRTRMEADARRIARLPDLEVEVLRLREALDSIYVFANDTLSGRTDGGPDDRSWQRSAVVEIRNRARPFHKPLKFNDP